jgi:hypothetical protein
MSSRKPFLFILSSILLITSVFLLWPTSSANAQCGSQASSCKSCHEVQAEFPVNNDGTDWHQSHAFGDFCEFCHAGNVQAPEMEAAHVGLVAPLDDVKAGCSACHANDLMEKAEVYAVALGVEIGSGGGGSAAPASTDSAGTDTAVSTTTEPVAATAVTFAPEMDINDPNVIDYVQRYEEIVLGIHPTNWGNVILMVFIGAVVVGGGAFVVKNEHWLEEDEAVVGGTAVATINTPETNKLLTQLNKLPPEGQKALAALLEKPEEATQLFQTISKMKK